MAALPEVKPVGTPSSQAQFPPLVLTNNSLFDVVTLLKTSQIVALCTENYWRVFHTLDAVNLAERRVIYLDCNFNPELLNDEEWPYYLKEAIPNLKELSKVDGLMKRIINQVDVPHAVHIDLGF